MKSKIYINLLAACLLLLAACRREYAPDYDNARSTALLDALDAMEKNQDDKAARILRVYGDVQGGNFAEEMMLVIQKRQQMKVIDSFLAKGDFQSLRLYLEEKQNTGEASTELLAMKSLPDDLQALALFCSKMPWENARSLKDALSELQTSASNLEDYPTFKKFRQTQLKTLKRLEQKEYRERTRQSLLALDQAVATQNTQGTAAAARDFARASASNAFEKAIALAKKGNPRPLGNPELFAIAVAHSWNDLTPARRSICAKALQAAGKPKNLCGELVAAWTDGRPEQWEELFASYRRQSLSPPPATAVAYVKALAKQGIHPASPSVVPGYTDVVSGILHLNTITQEKQ